MAEDSIIKYSDLIGKDGTFEEVLANLKKIEKELIQLAKNAKKAFANLSPNDLAGMQKMEASVRELNQLKKNQVKAEKLVQKVQKDTIKLTQEELIQREALKLEKREATQIAKQQAIILKAEKNNVASLRAQLALSTLEWKKFTAAEIDNTKEGRKAFNDKKRLTEQLKKLEKATGDNRREVGNYGLALNKLGKSANRTKKILIGLFVGRNIISGIQRIGGAFKTLVDDFRGSDDVIGGVGKSFDKVTGALQFAGVKILRFLAPAIEYVANLLSKLPAVFAGIAAGASQFGTNVGATFKKLGLQIELVFAKINRNNPFSDQNAAQIEANIKRVEDAIQAQTDTQAGVAEAYKTAYDAVIKEQEEFTNKQAEADSAAAAKKASADRKRLQEQIEREKEAQQKILEARLKVIISFQKQLKTLEAENINDARESAAELEELRFKEEQLLRTSQFDELEAFFKGNEKKLTELQELEGKIREEKLKQHKENLLSITKEYAIKTNDIEAINVLDDANKEEKALLAEKVELVEDSNKKIEESNDKLIENISASAQKVGELITKLFEKQADISKENVDRQVDTLNKAREDSAKGYERNLAFEESELSKRQAEQQKKEKEAKQAASILALFNLVSAYAAGGDENALARGLLDWSLLTALDNFYEGTEDTGTSANPLDSKGGRLVVAHDNERIVPKYLNNQLKGMSNEELTQNAILGQQMGDYMPMQSPMIQLDYKAQQEAFNSSVKVTQGNNEMVKELKAIKTHLANQPNVGLMLEQVYEDVYQLVKREQKSQLTKISKKFLRAK